MMGAAFTLSKRENKGKSILNRGYKVNKINVLNRRFRREKPASSPKSAFSGPSLLPLILVILLIPFYLLVLVGDSILRMGAQFTGKLRESGIL